MKETFEMKKTLFRSEMELKLDTGGDLHGWICSYWRTNHFIFSLRWTFEYLHDIVLNQRKDEYFWD